MAGTLAVPCVSPGWRPSTADLDQDFHVVLAGQEPLEPVLQHGDHRRHRGAAPLQPGHVSSPAHRPFVERRPSTLPDPSCDQVRAPGSYTVPFAGAFPQVRRGGGGRESNPPASSRTHTGFEGMSDARTAFRPVTSVSVFGRRPRTCKDLWGRSGSKTCPAAWDDLSGITSSISALPARGRDTRRGKPRSFPISGTSPRLDGIEWGCCPR